MMVSTKAPPKTSAMSVAESAAKSTPEAKSASKSTPESTTSVRGLRTLQIRFLRCNCYDCRRRRFYHLDQLIRLLLQLRRIGQDNCNVGSQYNEHLKYYSNKITFK